MNSGEGDIQMRAKALILALIIVFISFACEKGHKESLKTESFQKEFLIGKYFGVNFEGEDDLHVLQFNLYRMPSGEIKGEIIMIYLYCLIPSLKKR